MNIKKNKSLPEFRDDSRHRMLEIVQNLEFLNSSPDLIKKDLSDFGSILVENWPNCKYAFCFHDKDIDPSTNLPKSPHIHFDMYNPGANFRDSSVRSVFVDFWGPDSLAPGFQQFERIKSGRFYDAYNYLTHSDYFTPGVSHYSPSDIVCNFDISLGLEIKKIQKSSKHDPFRAAEILDLCASGSVRSFSVDESISPLEQVTYNKEISKGFEIARRRGLLTPDRSKPLQVFWFYGPSGTGKSSLAVQMCKSDGLSYCFTSSKDFMGNYLDQDCLIIDDLRPCNIDAQKLLSILNLHNAPGVSSRYHDKVFIGSRIIITCPLSPFEFWASISFNKTDEVNQLYRRLTCGAWRFHYDDGSPDPSDPSASPIAPGFYIDVLSYDGFGHCVDFYRVPHPLNSSLSSSSASPYNPLKASALFSSVPSLPSSSSSSYYYKNPLFD